MTDGGMKACYEDLNRTAAKTILLIRDICRFRACAGKNTAAGFVGLDFDGDTKVGMLVENEGGFGMQIYNETPSEMETLIQLVTDGLSDLCLTRCRMEPVPFSRESEERAEQLSRLYRKETAHYYYLRIDLAW